jgi:hypothetical protein
LHHGKTRRTTKTAPRYPVAHAANFCSVRTWWQLTIIGLSLAHPVHRFQAGAGWRLGKHGRCRGDDQANARRIPAAFQGRTKRAVGVAADSGIRTTRGGAAIPLANEAAPTSQGNWGFGGEEVGTTLAGERATARYWSCVTAGYVRSPTSGTEFTKTIFSIRGYTGHPQSYPQQRERLRTAN